MIKLVIASALIAASTSFVETKSTDELKVIERVTTPKTRVLSFNEMSTTSIQDLGDQNVNQEKKEEKSFDTTRWNTIIELNQKR